MARFVAVPGEKGKAFKRPASPQDKGASPGQAEKSGDVFGSAIGENAISSFITVIPALVDAVEKNVKLFLMRRSHAPHECVQQIIGKF